MSSDMEEALEAVRDWQANHPDGGRKPKSQTLPELRQGDRVIDMGGDGSLLFIAGFERNGNEEYHARCLVLGTDKVERVPVSRLKFSNVQTIH
jgi:hypothetical protein